MWGCSGRAPGATGSTKEPAAGTVVDPGTVVAGGTVDVTAGPGSAGAGEMGRLLVGVPVEGGGVVVAGGDVVSVVVVEGAGATETWVRSFRP